MPPASSIRRLAVLVAALPIAFAVALHRSTPTAEASPVRVREVARIRAHFDSVLDELASHGVDQLTRSQRVHRATLLATLRAYRDRGVFPHNYDFPGRAVPYFVDRKTGTRCAVAHLLAATGRRDIVDRVARSNNNVAVPALAHDTAFTGWLDASGLTLAEAARIQVPYTQGGSMAETVVVPLGAVATLGGAAITSLVNVGTNRDGHGRVRNALGLAFGGAAIGFGAAAAAGDDVPASWGVATVASGAVSAFVSARGIGRHRQIVAAQRRTLRPIVTPVVPLDGRSGAGLAVAMRF